MNKTIKKKKYSIKNIPVAKEYHASYENFTARCPCCGKENVFNRASDLCTFNPISGKNITCLNKKCAKPYRIIGDRINNPHEMLIFDCYELIERKHYMNCILNLAQAYEVFFSLYLRVVLLYKPFSLDHNIVELNRITEALYNKIKKHTFTRMRALFLHYMVAGKLPRNLSEAETLIGNLPDKPDEPKDADIKKLGDVKLISLLMNLKETRIHKLRNDIVHKDAYRPTREEVEAAIEEARSILFPLTRHLQLHHDINWYCLKRKSSVT